MALNVTTKPKVSILIPVWGNDYVGNLLRYLLPSLMAPGNLPVLSKACDTEVIFLTTKADFQYISCQRIFHNIGEVSKTTFIEIDDLLADIFTGKNFYGYVLTYAYMKGIKAAGQEIINTYFIFLVSDYLLGENCFIALLDKIMENKKVVISGSLRVDKEKAEKYINTNNFFKENTLAISHRTLVKIALECPHPSFVSKIVNSGFSFSYYSQHLYWLIDENTFIGRFFLGHMFCLKPEIIENEVVGFSDFSFIPQLCPTSDFAYLNDSDDFVAIELQNREHEMSYSCYGFEDAARAATQLETWLTKEHKAFSFQEFIFHAEEIPIYQYNKVSKGADEFIKSIHVQLTAPDVSHIKHPYWYSMYETYVNNLGMLEMDYLSPFLSRLSKSDFNKFQHNNDSIFSVNWLDYREFFNKLPSFFMPLKKVLLVSNLEHSGLHYLEPYQDKVLRISIETLFNTKEVNVDTEVAHDQEMLFDGVLFLLTENERAWMPKIIQKAVSLCNNGHNVFVYVSNKNKQIKLNEYVDRLFLKGFEINFFSAVNHNTYLEFLKRYQAKTLFSKAFIKIATAIINRWLLKKRKTIQLDLSFSSLLAQMKK